VSGGNRFSPMRFVVGFGVVSALGDFVYEGARSNIGPYLGHLGASAALVGLITGVGEAMAYAMRLVTGPLVDRTHKPWPQTMLGYVLQMVCVPMLAIAPGLGTAALLYNGERFGKAVRNPARDVMLAHASARIGRGKAFGIHEALDQFGALVGPLVIAGVLVLGGSLRMSFAVLAIPGAAALLALARLRRGAPDPVLYDPTAKVNEKKRLRLEKGLPGRFWLYAAFSGATMLGFATWAVMAYHLATHQLVSPALVPVLYALAMGTAALSALLFGHLYDKVGLKGLVVLPPLAVAVPLLSFSSSVAAVTIGAVIWGLVMGVHESTMSAAVADLVPAHRRGAGYGVFTAIYGIGWMVGATLIGVLYEHGMSAVVWYVAGTQIVAILLVVPLIFSSSPAESRA